MYALVEQSKPRRAQARPFVVTAPEKIASPIVALSERLHCSPERCAQIMLMMCLESWSQTITETDAEELLGLLQGLLDEEPGDAIDQWNVWASEQEVQP